MAQPLPNPNPILPDNPEYLPIHTRNYEVRAFKVNDNEILLWGAVRDDKPAGMYVQNDNEALTIHHMVVQLRISFPMMEILDASAELKEFPHHECPGIGIKYKGLIGLSIARGFTHKVRELFGGPRGCTHTTALLQAMGPVAIQCGWSMREEGEQVRRIRAGEDIGAPLSVTRRLDKLGRDPGEWGRIRG